MDKQELNIVKDNNIQISITEKLDTIIKLLNRFDRPHLGVIEASEYLGIGVSTIYTFVNKRQIPFYKPKGRLYFRKNELDEWIFQNRYSTDYEIRQKAKSKVVLELSSNL